MKITNISLAIFTSLFISCSDEIHLDLDKGQPLRISVRASNATSRAIITENYLPDGSQIGLSLVKEDGSNYNGNSYQNMSYSLIHGENWESEEDILLTASKGKAVAYYPYSSDVTDLTAIPIETSSQTDYMYSEWVTGIYNRAPQAEFTMKHALSVIRIQVKRGNYTSSGNITNLSFSCTGFGKSALLDATNGSISSTTGTGSTFASDHNEALSQEGFEMETLIIPVPSVTEGDISFVVTMDGQSFRASCSFNTPFAQGSIYTYTLQINGTDMIIEGVTVSSWNEHTMNEQTLIDEKWRYAIHTTYSLDTDGTLQLLSADTRFDISSVSYMMVDGVEITPSTQITTTAGTHTAKIVFTDPTLIPNCSFADCSNLTDIELPSCIKTIQDIVFQNCSKLDNLIIPKDAKIQSIGYYAFNRCTSLDINWEDLQYLEILGEAAFINCTGITSVHIPKSLTYLEGGTFANCTGITDVTFHDAFTTIGRLAFQSCTGITSIELPSSLTTINEGAFYRTSITEITLPPSLINIGPSTFRDCKSLKLADFSQAKDLTYMSKWLFYECTGLLNVIYPPNLQELQFAAFYYCTSLTKVYIPASVTSIGYAPYCGCIGITELIVDEDNPVFDSRNNCNGIVETASNSMIQGTLNSVIPDDIVMLEQGCFERLETLTEITIPASVTTIGDAAFWRCNALSKVISLAPTAPTLLFSDDGRIDVFGRVMTNGVLYIPEGATGYEAWLGTGDTELGYLNWSISYLTNTQ